ncbi:hypothetical protein ACFL0U_02330 [Pseudomonadota bacterium]
MPNPDVTKSILSGYCGMILVKFDTLELGFSKELRAKLKEHGREWACDHRVGKEVGSPIPAPEEQKHESR